MWIELKVLSQTYLSVRADGNWKQSVSFFHVPVSYLTGELRGWITRHSGMLIEFRRINGPSFAQSWTATQREHVTWPDFHSDLFFMSRRVLWRSHLLSSWSEVIMLHELVVSHYGASRCVIAAIIEAELRGRHGYGGTEGAMWTIELHAWRLEVTEQPNLIFSEWQKLITDYVRSPIKPHSPVIQNKSFGNYVLIPHFACKPIISCWRAFPLCKHRSCTPVALNADELLIASLLTLALVQDHVLSTNSAPMISISGPHRISCRFFSTVAQLDYYCFLKERNCEADQCWKTSVGAAIKEVP